MTAENGHAADGDSDAIKESIRCWDALPTSGKSMRMFNPIRHIVDPILANIKSGADRADGKNPISLALGDPTVAGNLPACPMAINTILNLMNDADSDYAASYVDPCGTADVREAIARYHSTYVQSCNAQDDHDHDPTFPVECMAVTADDVIVGNSCVGGLVLALTGMLDDGKTDSPDASIVLVPQPGFPMYEVTAHSHGARVVHYRLLAEKGWECDMDHLEQIMTQHDPFLIRAIVVNNPGNPTGAVYSKKHLMDIVAFCYRYKIPILTDEVYGDMTYKDMVHSTETTYRRHIFYPMAQIAAEWAHQQPEPTSRVPVITASGISKLFLLPGWRVGWLVFHDNEEHSMYELKMGIARLAAIVQGASHLPQKVVQPLLDPSNTELTKWKEELRVTLEHQVIFFCEQLATIPGLEPQQSGGAMYVMVKIDVNQFDDSIPNDVEFCQKLLLEENVICLPGQCFGVENMFRVVICPPPKMLQDATERLRQFCARHSQQQSNESIGVQ